MKKLSSIALALALAAGGIAAAIPAQAQEAAAQAAPAAAPERKFDLSAKARPKIAALQTAVNAKDDAAYATALPAAQQVAKTADDKYVIGQLQLQWGVAKQDDRLQLAAVEALAASGGAQPNEMTTIYQNIAALKTRLGDTAGAQAAFAKFAETQPNNPDVMVSQAEMTATGGQPAQAIPMFEKAIEAKKASGQPVPEAWYKRALKFAYEGKNKPVTTKLSRELITAYPTPENWRDGIAIYRETSQLDGAAEIDLLRFMRGAKAMNAEGDYYQLARELNDGGFPGEAKAVLDEGVAKRVVNPSKDGFKQLIAAAGGRVAEDRQSLPALEKKAMGPGTGKDALTTADAFYGYGDYAKAAALYKVALQKGGVDASLVNTRLGAALAMAGQKAEAEAAFKSVTGVRQDLAGFWLLWLGRSA